MNEQQNYSNKYLSTKTFENIQQNKCNKKKNTQKKETKVWKKKVIN